MISLTNYQLSEALKDLKLESKQILAQILTIATTQTSAVGANITVPLTHAVNSNAGVTVGAAVGALIPASASGAFPSSWNQSVGHTCPFIVSQPGYNACTGLSVFT